MPYVEIDQVEGPVAGHRLHRRPLMRYLTFLLGLVTHESSGCLKATYWHNDYFLEKMAVEDSESCIVSMTTCVVLRLNPFVHRYCDIPSLLYKQQMFMPDVMMQTFQVYKYKRAYFQEIKQYFA
jgi:hypothetical protein